MKRIDEGRRITRRARLIAEILEAPGDCRLRKQPVRECMWTVEHQRRGRQAWCIVVEEEWVQGRSQSKQFSVYAISTPLGCRNSTHVFKTLAQARKWASKMVTIYGDFWTSQAWQPDKFVNSRRHDPFWNPPTSITSA